MSGTALSGATKRKRDDTDASKDKKKRRSSKKPKDIDEEDLDESLGLNLAIARMDNQLLVDYVARRTKQFEPKLSHVELEDRNIPANLVLDTSSWQEARDLESLPSFLENFTEGQNLSKAPKDVGSPHTIVVAGAGLRAADVTRSLRKFQTKDAMVAKLFAKHIKLKESIETCKTKRINFGVGTPQRILDLIQDGSLSTRHLKRIVIDASHIDQRKRGILEMKDTQTPLMKLLHSPALKDRYTSLKKSVLIFY